MNNSAAIFGHFSGVPRLPDQENGNISIYWFEHGWFWVIPLPDDRTSVGMVCWPKFMKTRQGSLEEFFWQGVAQSGALKERMKDAKALQDITATGNFSYSASAMYGHRYVLVGDAYAFIDPVFSSGVYLAMKSAEFAADAVSDSLTQPHQMARHLKTYERRVTKGLKLFSWFIYRFTSPAMRTLLLKPTAVT
ncbi:NAD(P)/FAD-dependent oxidoreductase, partial [Pseudomonadota bacterium]